MHSTASRVPPRSSSSPTTSTATRRTSATKRIVLASSISLAQRNLHFAVWFLLRVARCIQSCAATVRPPLTPPLSPTKCCPSWVARRIPVGVHLGFLTSLREMVPLAEKKPSGGFERRERDRGGFFDSHSRADESESWVSNKSFVPLERRFPSNGGGFEREMKVIEFGSNDSVDSNDWNKKKEESNVGSESVGADGGRPRLILQPRSLSVSSEGGMGMWRNLKELRIQVEVMPL
ncbi:hypothetical protein LR48_Vigan07g223800 [Vigna angularis]|uniref:Uncharacterized protein n=1 Tax=Phaseolus angularis TaxID=3914 RepID=A0A0L9V1C0_PHAAN|nr:hypothetical protein LR48_Vigan07g223800 [Vigna angularis]